MSNAKLYYNLWSRTVQLFPLYLKSEEVLVLPDGHLYSGLQHTSHTDGISKVEDRGL